METLRAIFAKLRAATQAVIKPVQRVVMTVSLFLVYFVAIGLTKMFAAVFQRRLVRWESAGKDSYWVPAEGYEPDPDRAIHQT